MQTTSSDRHNTSSPGRESLSLRSDDIPGAKAKPLAITKNILHYKDRLAGVDLNKYHHNLQKQQTFNSHDYIFGGELKSGIQKALPHGKRHYGDHYRSEIYDKGGIRGITRDDPTETTVQAFDYNRNLNIADIPGTLAGSTKSKALVSHDLAQRLRKGSSVQRERPEPMASDRRNVGDSLDRFQQEVSENRGREKRGSQLEALENRHIAVIQQYGAAESGRRETTKENASEGHIKQVYDSAALYRKAAGAPTRTRDMSFDGVPRKGSSQDFTAMYDKRESGINTDRRDEAQNRLNDSSQNGSKSNGGSTPNESISGMRRKGNEQQMLAMKDSTGWRESVLEQAYGKLMNKKDDYKKVYTFNIISNQPNPKMLPTNARLPYRYAIPFDVDQLTASKRENSREHEQHNQLEAKRAHNLLLQHNNNIGREYNQSVPLGREPYNGPM